MALSKREQRIRIKTRVRSKIKGSAERPRLTIFRSNKEIYAQVVNDLDGRTICAVGSLKLAGAEKVNKVEQAAMVGKAVADKAKAAGVESA